MFILFKTSSTNMLYADAKSQCTTDGLATARFNTQAEYNKILEMIGIFAEKMRSNCCYFFMDMPEQFFKVLLVFLASRT